MSKRKWTPILWLGLLTFLFLVLAFHPATQWRARVLQLKLDGSLQMLTWPEIWRAIAEPDKNAYLNLLCEELVSGRATFDGYEDCECPIMWDTPLGVIWGRFEDGYWIERLLEEQIERYYYQNETVRVHEGDVVLDVGSHLGLFTRSALQSGAQIVVAFEPEPTNIACFKRTFASELAEGRVILIEAAAMETSGKVSFEVDTHDSVASKVKEDGHVTVQAVTIDETVELLGLDRVDFIKMDIEGSERHALAGAARTMSHFAPRMAICIYHRADDPSVISCLVLASQPRYQIVKDKRLAYFFSPGD